MFVYNIPEIPVSPKGKDIFSADLEKSQLNFIFGKKNFQVTNNKAIILKQCTFENKNIKANPKIQI